MYNPGTVYVKCRNCEFYSHCADRKQVAVNVLQTTQDTATVRFEEWLKFALSF